MDEHIARYLKAEGLEKDAADEFQKVRLRSTILSFLRDHPLFLKRVARREIDRFRFTILISFLRPADRAGD